MPRLLVAVVAAVALAGCGGGDRGGEAPPAVVALGYGEAIADHDVQLAGVQRAADDVNTRKAANDLWRETVRTALELPKKIDAEGPIGGSLIVAADQARAAAHALQPPRPPSADVVAATALRRSAAALGRAADALAARLPRSDAGDLEKLRTALPPD